MDRRLSALFLLVTALALTAALSGCRGRNSETEAVQFAPFNGTVTEGPETTGTPPPGAEVAATPESSAPSATPPATAAPGDAGTASRGSTSGTKPEREGAAVTTGRPRTSGGSPGGSGGSASGGAASGGGAPANAERRSPQSGGPPTGPSDRGGDGEDRPRGPFERFDANGDGKLAAAEIPEPFRERMMNADTDGDGAVTRAEMQAAMQAMRERWQAAGGGPAGPGGPGGPGRLRDPFERYDANGDGILTTAEVPEDARERVMRSDGNGDGKLTRDEWEAAMRAFRERMQSGAGRRGGGD